MAKRKLLDIAEDYEIPFDEALSWAQNHLREEDFSGRGKNTWVSEEGQAILENVVPMPRLLRGKVVGNCSNSAYSYVRCQDLCSRVAVKFPTKLQGKMVGKVVYFSEDRSGAEVKYHYQRRPENF